MVYANSETETFVRLAETVFVIVRIRIEHFEIIIT